MNRKKSTKKVILFIAVVNLVVATILGVLSFQVKSIIAETMETNQKIGSTMARLESLDVLERSVENTKDDQESLNRYLVKESETIDFMALVEELAYPSGAMVNIESANTKTTEDENTVFELSVSAVGSFREVYHVLTLLESMPYKIVIMNASMNALSEVLTQDVNERRSAEDTQTRQNEAGELLGDRSDETAVASTTDATSADNRASSSSEGESSTTDLIDDFISQDFPLSGIEESQTEIKVQRRAWRAKVFFELRGYEVPQEEKEESEE